VTPDHADWHIQNSHKFFGDGALKQSLDAARVPGCDEHSVHMP
jgi:hypothetical protein